MITAAEIVGAVLNFRNDRKEKGGKVEVADMGMEDVGIIAMMIKMEGEIRCRDLV